MRRSPYRKNTGGIWLAGLGILGLLITVAIIMWLVSIETDQMVSSTGGRGPGPLLQDVKKQVEGFSQRNVNLGNRVAQEANEVVSPSPAPAAPVPIPSPGVEAQAPVPSPAPVVQAPSPAPAAPSPAPGTPSAAAGTPSGGTPIGPITPVTPLAPLQEGPGPNLRPASQPISGLNKAMDERNKELEKALQGN